MNVPPHLYIAGMQVIYIHLFIGEENNLMNISTSVIWISPDFKENNRKTDLDVSRANVQKCPDWSENTVVQIFRRITIICTGI